MAGESLLARLGIDTSDMKKGAKNAENIASGLGGKLKGIFAGVSAKIAFDWVTGAADELQNMADTLDMNVEELQRFRAAFAQGGTRGAEFERGMVKMTDSLSTARDGNEEMIASFARLGVSFDMLQAGTPGEIMLAISDGANKATDSVKLTADLVNVFGKGAAKLRPTLKEGAAGIIALGKSGVVASKENVAAVDSIGDAWEEFKRRGAAMAIDTVGIFKRAFSGDMSWMPFAEQTKKQVAEAKDELKGLTDWQKQQVQKFGMDPKQAAKLSPGAVPTHTEKEIAEQKELHDELHRRLNEENRLNQEIKTTRGEAMMEQLSAQEKLVVYGKLIDSLSEEAKDNDSVRTAELKAQVETLKQQAIQLAINEQLKTPDQRRQDTRDARRRRQASDRLERMSNSAAAELKRRQDLGIKVPENSRLRQLASLRNTDKPGGELKEANKTLTEIKTLLEGKYIAQ